MQLPKHVKRFRLKTKLKICQEPGCGKEYVGTAIAKYCGIHKDIRNRVRRRKKYDDPSVSNMIFKHGFREVTNIEFSCALTGCKNKYTVRVYPKQEIYPKYCKDHLSTFRRELFSRAGSLE